MQVFTSGYGCDHHIRPPLFEFDPLSLPQGGSTQAQYKISTTTFDLTVTQVVGWLLGWFEHKSNGPWFVSFSASLILRLKNYMNLAPNRMDVFDTFSNLCTFMCASSPSFAMSTTPAPAFSPRWPNRHVSKSANFSNIPSPSWFSRHTVYQTTSSSNSGF